MMTVTWRTNLSALLICASAVAGAAGQGEKASGQQIVFVCEHGAAKSVIAAAYFNKLAAERGLRERAIYRGASPQDELSVATLQGLREDGLPVPTSKPAPITAADVTAATHIFAIGANLPRHAVASGKAKNWSDVPEVSDGYAASRDAIKKHVERLIDQLEHPSGARR